MKVKYRGVSFGADSLTDATVYDCIGAEVDFLRVIDDSGEAYLYSPINPRPLNDSSPGGRREIIEDATDGTLGNLILAH